MFFKSHNQIFAALLVFFGIAHFLNFVHSSEINIETFDVANHKQNISGPLDRELVQGEKILGEITAKHNGMGTIWIRFYNYNRDNDDSVIFRIKEKDSSDWYFENKQSTSQFLPNKFFPFGFPVINNSKNKTYVFEVESLHGKPKNSISIDTTHGPTISVRYQQNLHAILANNIFPQYLISKTIEVVTYPNLIREFVAGFLPAILFVIFKKILKIKYLGFTLLSALIVISLFVKQISINHFYLIGFLGATIIGIQSEILIKKMIYITAVIFASLPVFYYVSPSQLIKLSSWGLITLMASLAAQVYQDSKKTPVDHHDANKQPYFIFSPYVKIIWSILTWPSIVKNWWVGIIAYFRTQITDKVVTYEMRNGLKLLSDFNCTDFQIIRELFQHNVYFKNFPMSFRKPIVMDVGAHKGYFALFVKLRYPSSKIFCLEPDPHNFNFLVKNIKLNKKRNIIPLNQALSNTKELRKFYLAEGSSVSHSLSSKNIRSKKAIYVKCVDIKSVLHEQKINHIDILKIDIEGFEYPVLFSLSKNILKKVKVFMVEAHKTSEHSIADLYKFFSKLGYKTYQPYPFENVLVAYKEN